MEFGLIVGHKRRVEAQALRGNQEIIRPDRSAISFEFGTNGAIVSIRVGLESDDLQITQDEFQPFGQPGRRFLCRAIAEFARDNNAREDRLLILRCDPLRNQTLRIAQKVRDDIGIE